MESENYRSVVVKLHLDTLVAIDSLREQWGINSRADIIERILHEVLTPDLTESQSSNPE
jgi:metal-responsive CopG/Arc/MetJ family transcriptional regulator